MPPRLRSLSAAVLALLLAVAGPASAQSFRGIFARGANDAIAVGDLGKVYRTLDGGLTWSERTLGPASGELRHVAGRGLTLVIVGSDGAIWKSVDAGGNWTLTTIPGQPFLRGLSMPTDSTWFAAGSSGSVLRTTDAGTTWTPLASGSASTLYTACFTDAMHGWVAGDLGTLLATSDGGDTWSAVSLGTDHRLISVDQRGAVVWAVGLDAAAYRSTNGGATFQPVNLKLDDRADVRVVSMRSPDSLWIAGGGGFIRWTTDGGATWTFPQHSLHGEISDLSSSGAGVFACSNKNVAIVASGDLGATWHLASGATLTRTWGATPRYAAGASARGNGFAINPVYKSTLYCALGNNVLRSRDDGDTWSVAATFPANYIKCNAFLVSPKDTNVWLAAISGSTVSDRIFRTTDGGLSWTAMLTHDFGEYGIPLEMDPDHPDTVWFGGEYGASGSPQVPLRRSTDFGLTWNPIATAVFRSPCDIVVVPDATNIVVVADGVTGIGRGRHLKSVDGGMTFVVVDSTISQASEIPGLACSRLRTQQIVGTEWSGGGVQRSMDTGSTWPTVDNTSQPWGIDICRDDPNVVVFAQYSSSNGSPLAYISLNGGATYTVIPTPTANFNNNYGIYARDRATIFAEQSTGIWKLQNNYAYTPVTPTQSLSLTAPDGGESWAPGTVHAIQWSAASVAVARIEYRRSAADPWQPIADVPGTAGSYAWTVPWDGTSTARVRVSDLWDGAPRDSSSATFTIAAPRLVETPLALDFGTQNASTATRLPITIQNIGALPLHVTSIGTATGEFAVGRTSVTIAAGAQDTVGVWFVPDYGGAFTDTVTLVSDDLGRSPWRVPVAGQAVGPQVRLVAPNGGESWVGGSVHSIAWWDTLVTLVDLDYRVHPDSAWVIIAAGVPADPPQYAWTVPAIMTSQAQVRIRNDSGPPEDASDAVFAFAVAMFAALPETLALPPAGMSGFSGGAFTLSNPGNYPLTVSGITVSDPEFWVGRTSLVIPAASSDTVGVYYTPADAGADTAQLTIVASDPASPHTLVATGQWSASLAVGPGETGAAFALSQNRPNPFHRETMIAYTLARDADVSLDVFDLHGQRVATLAHGRQAAGSHVARFGRAATAGGPLPAGVYFYRLRAGSLAATRRMLLIP